MLTKRQPRAVPLLSEYMKCSMGAFICIQLKVIDEQLARGSRRRLMSGLD